MADGAHLGLLVRQQAWFRPFVDVIELPAFPADSATQIALSPIGAFRTRVVVGRGPIDIELPPAFRLFFQHERSEYPTFTSPGTSPGGALYANKENRSLRTSEKEALCLVETTLVQPLSADFHGQYDEIGESNIDVFTAIPEIDFGLREMAEPLLRQASEWLEHAVGLYALYQFPVVWEPLATVPYSAVFDLKAAKQKGLTSRSLDSRVPFQLKLGSKLMDCQLRDGCLSDFAKLSNGKFHLPLVLLQRSLWQPNVQVRYLETFLLLDHLTSQFVFDDPKRKQREELYSLVQSCIEDKEPEHKERVKALKGTILQAPLRERMQGYLQSLGLRCTDDFLGKALKLRNRLAHGHPIDTGELAMIDAELGPLARTALRVELMRAGLRFEASQDAEY